MFELDDTKNFGANIKVVGLGGGGGNAINTMIKMGLNGVEFIVANTDKQSLEDNKAQLKVQLGTKTTKGLGAGGNPDVGRASALEDQEILKSVLAGADMVFITAGMGGGTGTGSAPVVAKIARDLGALTIGVVTKPFMFEGKKRQKQAELGIEELNKYVDTLITIPNERLKKTIGQDTPYVEAFKKVDEILLYAVKGISDLINKSGHINLDFADIRTIIKNNKGMAFVGIGEGTGENKAVKAAVSAMTSPVLGDIKITNATGLILNVTINPNIPMSDVTKAIDYVTQEAGDDIEVKFGVVTDSDMGDEIKVTIVATGFSILDHDSAAKTLETEKDAEKIQEKAQEKDISASLAELMGTYHTTKTSNSHKRDTVQRPVVHRDSVPNQEDLFAVNNETSCSDEDYLDIPPYLRNQKRL
jgi:cell division protein FtsZ